MFAPGKYRSGFHIETVQNAINALFKIHLETVHVYHFIREYTGMRKI
jgi:hypothetical protein